MIRNFVTRLVIVALLAFCGYKSWQVYQLQRDVARLTAEVHASHVKMSRQSVDDPESGSAFARADRHLHLAQDAMARYDFGTAWSEWSLGMDAYRKAADEPRAKTEAGVKEAEAHLKSLKSQLNDLLKQLPIGNKSTD